MVRMGTAIPAPWHTAKMRIGVLELQEDFASAAWLGDELTTFGDSVGSVVPARFEAYARVFHPFRLNGVPMPWSAVAAERGTVVHPAMQFEGVTGQLDRYVCGSAPLEWEPPEEGSLPRDIGLSLAGALQAFTSTPDRCWFGVWEGFGGLRIGPQRPGASGLLTSTVPSRLKTRYRGLQEYRSWKRSLRLPIPRRLELPGRAYYLFTGPIEGIGETFLVERHSWAPWQSANLWWPDDRAWFVATEIDFMSTYVGGSRPCIDAILATDGLEVIEVEVDQPVGTEADTINPRPVSDPN